MSSSKVRARQTQAVANRVQVVEVIAQMAFYSGVPSAIIGLDVAKQAFDGRGQ